jgi:hypothetical protein
MKWRFVLIVQIKQLAMYQKTKVHNGGHVMEGIYFLILWLGGALLHTLYDLKLKSYLKTFSDEAKNWPFS